MQSYHEVSARVGQKGHHQKVYEYGQQASLVAQLVKNPPAKQETLVPSLGREDPLEKG